MISNKFMVMTNDALDHALRDLTPEELVARWTELLTDDDVLAWRWLLLLRDPRGGLGERAVFRTILTTLVNRNVVLGLTFARTVDVPTLGRWDDLVYIYANVKHTAVQGVVLERIAIQLDEDIRLVAEGRRPSLMAKWLPSINASSAATRAVANRLARDLHRTPRGYRRTLSELRAALELIETSLSTGRSIGSNLPARAVRRYANALQRRGVAVNQGTRPTPVRPRTLTELETMLLSSRYAAAEQLV